MTNMLKNIAKSEEGFTLIELLVVILIFGILLAIALPMFLGQQDKAKDTDAKSRLNTAYKTVKSEIAGNSGVMPGATALASAVNTSEPGMNFTVAASTAATTGNVVQETGGTASSFTLYTKSDSGKICSLAVSANVLGDPTCS